MSLMWLLLAINREWLLIFQVFPKMKGLTFRVKTSRFIGWISFFLRHEKTFADPTDNPTMSFLLKSDIGGIKPKDPRFIGEKKGISLFFENDFFPNEFPFAWVFAHHRVGPIFGEGQCTGLLIGMNIALANKGSLLRIEGHVVTARIVSKRNLDDPVIVVIGILGRLDIAGAFDLECHLTVGCGHDDRAGIIEKTPRSLSL